MKSTVAVLKVACAGFCRLLLPGAGGSFYFIFKSPLFAST